MKHAKTILPATVAVLGAVTLSLVGTSRVVPVGVAPAAAGTTASPSACACPTFSLANLDPVMARFVRALAAHPGPPLPSLPIPAERAVLTGLQAAYPAPKLPAAEADLTIPGGPTGRVLLTIVRPPDATRPLPAIIYIHGGGWILGDKSTHDRLIRQIANEAGAAVVFVNYRRSPEGHYPVALEQAYTAARYVAAHGAGLHLDSSRMAVAGDSVGGNMATALAMLAKERGGPHLLYQVLFYPATDARFTDASYQEFAKGPWLTKTNMEWYWRAYIPNPADRLVPTASPLEASLSQLHGLPPAMVITDENDVLRDEGEAYAHKLMQAGVRVTAVRYLGAIHDFVMLNALSSSPEAVGAVAQATAALQNAFARYP